MSVDWQVTKGSRQCAVTNRPLEEGEVIYSALMEEGDTFTRLDYSLEAWDDVEKEAFFSYWRTRIQPEAERKRLVIDVEAFYTFFSNLGEPEEPHRKVFRYLVALILTRKRLLRLDEIEKTPEGEVLVLFDRRADAPVRIPCPEATEEQLGIAQESLNQIFECQIGVDDL